MSGWDGIDWLIAGGVGLYLMSLVVLVVCIRRAAPDPDEHSDYTRREG